MLVHQVYALIQDEKVQNIIVGDDYEFANQAAREFYGPGAIAVDCLQYRCAIGDTFKNNTFYHVNPETGEETPLEYVPTAEQQVVTLTEENNQLKAELTNVQLALVSMYEGGDN